jgi:hypothetical protein
MIARLWWEWIAATAVVYGVFFVILVLLDVDPRPVPLLLLVSLLMAVLLLVNTNLVAGGPDWEVQSSHPVNEPGQDARLGMYLRVIGDHLDAKSPDGALRDRLAELAATRLRQRHGIGLRDPGATDLLGREVTDILTGPPRRLGRGEIEDAVRRIEGL